MSPNISPGVPNILSSHHLSNKIMLILIKDRIITVLFLKLILNIFRTDCIFHMKKKKKPYQKLKSK